MNQNRKSDQSNSQTEKPFLAESQLSQLLRPKWRDYHHDQSKKTLYPKPEKKRPSFFSIIIKLWFPLLLLPLTILILYIQYSKNNQITQQILLPQLQQQLPFQPTPTPPSTPTANWRTYTNETFSFSFKYPKTWILREYNGKSDSVSMSLFDEKAQELFEVDQVVQISIHQAADKIGNPEKSLKESIELFHSNPGIYSDPKGTLEIKEYILSDNSIALRGSIKSSKIISERVVFIKEEENKTLTGNINLLSSRKLNPIQRSETIETFNQILSTFKFITNSYSECTYDYQCGYCTDSYPENCVEGKCVNEKCILLPSWCAEMGGTWLEEYYECENINETTCTKLGGNYDACASGCRHNQSPSGGCAAVCIEICTFNN